MDGKTYNGDIWKENDLITFEKLQEALSYDGDKTKVNLKPIFIYVPATFDLSSLPNNIEIRQPELIVIFDEQIVIIHSYCRISRMNLKIQIMCLLDGKISN